MVNAEYDHCGRGSLKEYTWLQYSYTTELYVASLNISGESVSIYIYIGKSCLPFNVSVCKLLDHCHVLFLQIHSYILQIA